MVFHIVEKASTPTGQGSRFSRRDKRQSGRSRFGVSAVGERQSLLHQRQTIYRIAMASQAHIRAARREDRDKLGALKLRSSLAWGDHVEELQALPEARQVPAAHLPFVIVAELAGEIIGFATILPGGEDLQAELEDLFVAPKIWRRGVGGQLVAEAERRAVALGACSLHVVANERARAFYEASGFRIIGTVMTDFAPAPEMHKNLQQVG